MRENLRNVVYFALVASQMMFCIVSYIPQIVQLVRTKKSEDISVATWMMLTFSFVDYGLILLMEDAGPVLLTLNGFELVLCAVTLSLTMHYKKHDDRQKSADCDAVQQKGTEEHNAL